MLAGSLAFRVQDAGCRVQGGSLNVCSTGSGFREGRGEYFAADAVPAARSIADNDRGGDSGGTGWMTAEREAFLIMLTALPQPPNNKRSTLNQGGDSGGNINGEYFAADAVPAARSIADIAPLRPESQGQNLALTALYVPCSLNGGGRCRGPP